MISLKNLFSKTNDRAIYDPYFPQETEVSTISVSENIITVHTQSKQEDINSNNLLFISVMVYSQDNKSMVCLCLIDKSYIRKYLYAHFRGFRLAYNYLWQKYGFDSSRFYEISHLSKSASLIIGVKEKLIWRNNQNENFSIVTETKDDTLEGFELLGPQPAFIAWRTEGRELKKKYPDLVYETKTEPLQIVCPIRIGNIVIKEKFYYTKSSLSFALRLPFEGNNSFIVLESALRKVLRSDKPLVKKFDGDSLVFTEERSRLTFMLSYSSLVGSVESSSISFFTDPDTTYFTIEISKNVPRLTLEERQAKKEERDSKHTYDYRVKNGY